MRIIRVAAGAFTSVPNSAARDNRLSWAARGILLYLLSHRNGYPMDADRIVSAGPGGDGRGNGRSAVLARLRELEDNGYVSRRRVQQSDGTWITTFEVSDTPRGASDWSDGSIEMPSAYPQVRPTVGEPTPVIPTPLCREKTIEEHQELSLRMPQRVVEQTRKTGDVERAPLPPDWTPPPDLLAWARNLGIADEDITDETTRFTAWYADRTEPAERWIARWKVWIHRGTTRRKPRPHTTDQPRRSGGPRVVLDAAAARLVAAGPPADPADPAMTELRAVEALRIVLDYAPSFPVADTTPSTWWHGLSDLPYPDVLAAIHRHGRTAPDRQWPTPMGIRQQVISAAGDVRDRVGLDEGAAFRQAVRYNRWLALRRLNEAEPVMDSIAASAAREIGWSMFDGPERDVRTAFGAAWRRRVEEHEMAARGRGKTAPVADESSGTDVCIM